MWHLWRASRTRRWWAGKREVSGIQVQVSRTSCSSWRAEVEAVMQLRVMVLAASLTDVQNAWQKWQELVCGGRIYFGSQLCGTVHGGGMVAIGA